MTDRQRFILTTVANTYSMPEEDVLSRLRSKHTTLVRQICYWMMRKIMFMYVADIACAMKRRDHSCVCAGLKAVEKKRGMDVDFAKLLQYLETTIRRQLTPLDPAIAEKLCGELLCYA